MHRPASRPCQCRASSGHAGVPDQDRLTGTTARCLRSSWRLLLRYAAQATGTAPAALDLSQLDADLITGFLTHLDTERGNRTTTRNARLAAVLSLFSYAAYHHPEHAATTSRVLAIPAKRTHRTHPDSSPCLLRTARVVRPLLTLSGPPPGPTRRAPRRAAHVSWWRAARGQGSTSGAPRVPHPGPSGRGWAWVPTSRWPPPASARTHSGSSQTSCMTMSCSPRGRFLARA